MFIRVIRQATIILLLSLIALPALATPFATIQVDGEPNDWAGITPFFIDPEGDSSCTSDYDIKAIYTAIDNEYAYVMVETYGKPINPDAILEMNFDYKLGEYFWASYSDDLHTNIMPSGFYAYYSPLADGKVIPYPIAGYEIIYGNVMELKIPLSGIESPEYFNPTTANIWNPNTNVSCDPSIYRVQGMTRNLRLADDSFHTFISVYLQGFQGNQPDDIDSIEVVTPSGTVYTKNDFTYWEQFKEFELKLPGKPETGLYTYTVTAGGATITYPRALSVLRDIPIIPDSTRLPVEGVVLDTLTPTFSWDLVEYPGTDLYYRFEIWNLDGYRVFATGRLKDLSSFTVPQGVLTSGRTYIWRVKVTDSNNWVLVQNRSDSSSINFTIVDEIINPTANAGPDQVVLKNATLDGSQSVDEDGEIVSYQWSLVHRENSDFNVAATGAAPTVTNLEAGFYDVTLTVTDNHGFSGTDTMVLAVIAPSGIYTQDQVDQAVATAEAAKDAIIDQRDQVIDGLNAYIDSQNSIIVQNTLTISDQADTISELENLIDSMFTLEQLEEAIADACPGQSEHHGKHGKKGHKKEKIKQRH